MRIIFFGTPKFAANILTFLKESSHDVVAVVTRPDKPKGRSKKLAPSAVKDAVLKNWPRIPLFQPEKASTEAFAEILKSFKPDLFVVVAYGEIIKTNLLEIPKQMCINIHASLLPKYRGAAPIQRVIMEGEKETGITIIEMVLKMDAGKILEVAKISIGENENFGQIEEKLYKVSGPVLLNVIKKIESGTLEKVPQDEDQVTFTQKILVEDRLIHWSKSAEEIHNQIRGLSPHPGAFCFVEQNGQIKRLIIRKARKDLSKSGPVGSTLFYEQGEWIVGCGSGALSLIEIQLEGKKSLPIEEFIRGFLVPLKIKIA